MRALSDIRKYDASEVGAKAANLGEVAYAGLVVPPGLVSTGPSDLDLKAIQKIARKGLVAVRSSAVGEDSQSASFAGQHETILNVDSTDEAALWKAFSTVYNSRFQSEVYQQAVGVTIKNVPVIFQKMVKPLYAGVLFTAEPTLNDRSQGIIEYVRGLGDKLVEGSVTPKRIKYLIGSHFTGSSSYMHSYNHGSWKWQNVADVGQEIGGLFGVPMDIEWAYNRGRVYVLQARPITGVEWNDLAVVTGTSVFQEVARGKARWLSGKADEKILDEGDVLLTEMTSARMVGSMLRASAFATETGGVTCHAAILARELKKPCVVGCGKVLGSFSRLTIEVDGVAGTVRYVNPD